jgi:hypothetical protein
MAAGGAPFDHQFFVHVSETAAYHDDDSLIGQTRLPSPAVKPVREAVRVVLYSFSWLLPVRVVMT